MNAISTQTFRIKIQGRVQGVGFRPFVYKLAQEFKLLGQVYNNAEGVIIEVNIHPEKLGQFCTQLIEKAPPQSEILTLEKEESPSLGFSDFQILPSQKNQKLNLPLTPDFALCDQCRKDIRDPQNRRFQYPFTSCVNCGPRYALTQDFPFERDHTSLEAFPMCPVCTQEYENPNDRRFHSQTNSCPQCGPKTQLVDKQGTIISQDNTILFKKAAELIREGSILTLKNTSGYLLCGDARSAAVVRKIRERKRRPRKPLAVLYPSLDLLEAHFDLKAIEKQALTSSWAPIVLMGLERYRGNLARDEIAPDLNQLGVMLPHSALLQLLLDQLSFPIIATSGNIHGSPILREETEARQILASVADYFLEHNLPITFPQDDSVVKFSPKHEHAILMRRSRGLAPNYLSPSLKNHPPVLAMGAHLKNSIAFIPEKHVYLSPYFGNMDNYEVSLRSKETVDKYLNIFEKKPAFILVDQNPR
ncbi:MAG: Sua5/YciO/YrdC/YwlC family protein, partial [Bacteroidota bacterium]